MQYVYAGLIVASAFTLGGCAAVISAAHTGAAAVAAQGVGATLAVGAGAGVVAGLAAPELYKALKSTEDAQGAEQEPGIPGTFGAFLAASRAEVRTLVQRAIQGRREVLVVAGVRAQNAIARGRAAFRASLSLSVSALGEQEKKFKTEIEALVSNLYSPVDLGVKDAGERAKAIAHSLRFSSPVPLLNAGDPVFLFAFLPFQTITVSGNFPTAYGAADVPQLSIGGKSYKASDYASDRLSFSLPTADLNAAEAGEIVWKTGAISVPWIASSGFFAAAQIEQLGVDIAVLPHSFGRMSMDHAITSIRTEEKTRLSGEFPLTAANAEETQRQCLALTPQELADGWRLKPGSSAFVPGAGQAGLQIMDKWKEWKLSLASETAQAICWRASGAHAAEAAHAAASQGAAQGGKAGWKISATLWREVKEPGVTRENVDLAWGSKHFFKYPAGTWKLRYSRTGAGATELAAADTTHPLIRVSSDPSGVTVSIYPF